MKPFQSTQKTSSSSCDLTIIVEGKQFGAHWNILRERSTFFEEFYRRKKAKRKTFARTSCVHLKGVSSRLVGLFLQHVYTNNSNTKKPFQLELNEINEVLKFSIMFGLKDLQTPKGTDVGAQLDAIKESHRMSQLHRSLLQFLYPRTTGYKTRDLAMFVAHKAYTAADMGCLFDVLKIVNCTDCDKITMRLKLLNILIILFTVTLDETAELRELDTKGYEGVSRGSKQQESKERVSRCTGGANTPLLRAGYINETANPQLTTGNHKRLMKHQENSSKTSVLFSENTKKSAKKIQNVEQQDANSKNSKEMECLRKDTHTFSTAKAQNNCSSTKSSKHIRQRSPANRRIALIKEHLERINGYIAYVDERSPSCVSHNLRGNDERCNGQTTRVESRVARVDKPKTRVVKHVPRAYSSFNPEGHVLNNQGHVLGDEERVQGETKCVGLHSHKNNSTLARDYKEVARDTSMIKEEKVNEIEANMNERKAKLNNEQQPKIMTRKIRKMWTKDIQNAFPIIQPQDDKNMYKKTNGNKNPERQESLVCEEIGQTKVVSLCEEDCSPVLSSGSMKEANRIQNQPLKPDNDQLETFLNENLKASSSNEVLSEVVGNFTQERIYLTGGIQKNDYFAHKAILELNPETGAYTTRGAMQTGRYNHGIARLQNEIYLVGGNSGFFEQLRSVESYSPEHAQWTMKPSMREARDEFSLVVVLDCLYAIGGHNGVQDLRSVERFSTRENAWSFVSPMKHYRAGACAVAVNDRYIYVIGGFNGQSYLTNAEQYDVTAELWTQIQPMGNKRAYSCTVLLERGIYVLGGFDGHAALSSCEMFDIKAGSWQVLPDMNTPRMNATAVVYAGGILVLGGECDSVFLETVECYNITNKTWSFVHRLPQPMAGLRACVYPEKTEIAKSNGH